MPNKPKHIARPWKPERKPFEREVSNYDFYNSTAWRGFSKKFKEENPLCVDCEKEGRIVAGYFVDHIIPIRKGGKKFDKKNCQSLCGYHHNKKSSFDSCY